MAQHEHPSQSGEMYSFEPDWRSHPGDTLRDVLAERSLGVATVAKEIGYPPDMLEAVLKGTDSIRADLAVRLEAYFTGTPAEFWMKRQSDYDLHAARERIGPWLEQIEGLPR